MCSQQSRLTKKSNAKKTLANIEMARVKSVRRTRSRRMKFCVQRGLGGIPQQAALGSRGYPGALLASIIPNSVNQLLRSLMLQIKVVEYTPVE